MVIATMYITIIVLGFLTTLLQSAEILSCSFAVIRVGAPMDPAVKESVKRIPLCRTKAGPRDGGQWAQRLKEEYASLITFIETNKEEDNHWFTLESDETGTRWFGKCWHYYKHVRYEFDVEFDLPVTYPQSAPEIALPQLENKTMKMYRGGRICMTTHFHPLWARNVPFFGVAHAMALGLGPWLSVEIPAMVEDGVLQPTVKEGTAER
jgi:ufm1-conjugating enzyme 1